MTVCPVALAVGCRKCPIFTICPLKGVIGDQQPAKDATPDDERGEDRPRPRERAARGKRRGR